IQPKPRIIKNFTPMRLFKYTGYTENLKALIMKKEILSALKDINLLRKNPQMYPIEELNVWSINLLIG
ncbi:3285_t:CDS:2, partial [Funneliformis geosporum]